MKKLSYSVILLLFAVLCFSLEPQASRVGGINTSLRNFIYTCPQYAYYEVDLAGATADTTETSVVLPANCILTDFYVQVLDTVESADSASIAFFIGSTNIMALTAYDSFDVNFYDPTEIKRLVSGAFKWGNDSTITEGKIRFVVEYLKGGTVGE